MLAPGTYPVRVCVFGPTNEMMVERRMSVTVPVASGDDEPPFAMPVFAETVTADWPSGRYRFVASLERGGAAAGHAAEFHVHDAFEMPMIEDEIAVFGSDPDLEKWLREHGIRCRPFAPGAARREVILASGQSPDDAAWHELARSVAGGCVAIFLTPSTLAGTAGPLARLPVREKGELRTISSWLYLKDEWTKRHPIFDGLPCGGLMDLGFYREIISREVFSGQVASCEAIAGACLTSIGYDSGLMVAEYKLGAGAFIVNTLRVRELLGTDPVAERLLRNMLRYAAADLGDPPAFTPANFDGWLKEIGYA